MSDSSSAFVEASFGGARLRLWSERALSWPDRDLLVVSDPHFGKDASFRATGIPVPGGTTGADLARLDVLVEATGADRVVFLGDFLHDRASRSPATLDAISAWRERHEWLSVTLIVGNHDLRGGALPAEWRFEAMPEGSVGGIRFVHDPADAGDDAPTLAGHLHPAVRLRGPGRQSVRFPCFCLGPRIGLLPAFGGFTGCHEIRPGAEDRVFVVTPEGVARVGLVAARGARGR